MSDINAHPTEKPLLRFVVDYKDNYFTQTIESPAMTFELLLGDVGGQIHLFIGISFLSLLEVVELIVEFLILFYKVTVKKIAFQLIGTRQVFEIICF